MQLLCLLFTLLAAGQVPEAEAPSPAETQKAEPEAQAPADAAQPAAAAQEAPAPKAQAASVRKLMREEAKHKSVLPAHDKDDQVAYPRWFRILLRRNLKCLPEAGQPQYPAKAAELLRWLKSRRRYSEDELRSRLGELEKEVPAVAADNEKLAKYRAWEVDPPKGSELDKIRKKMQGRLDLLPPDDLQDQTALPIWFRAWLREKYPELPKTGQYQYPDSAQVMLSTLLNRAKRKL